MLDNFPPIQFRGLVVRPRRSLANLPFKYRWEFTRRHPYYGTCWQAAHRFYKGLSKPHQRKLDEQSAAALAAIGITADPPDPKTTAEELISAIDQTHFLGGAIEAVTYLSLAETLVAHLPASTLKAVAEIFLKASSDNVNDRAVLITEASLRLRAVQEFGLSNWIVGDLIGVNVSASGRAITESIEAYVRSRHKSRALPKTRRREDAYSKYLKVWDLREGWDGTGYSVLAEHSFADIADKLKIRKRTAADQYYAAFKFVSGFDYDIRVWARLFIVSKLDTEFGTKALKRRSLTRSASTSVGTVAKFRQPLYHVPFVGGGHRFEADVIDFIDAMKSHFRAGMSDSEIIDATPDLCESDITRSLLARIREHEDWSPNVK